MYKKYKLKNGKNVTRKDLLAILEWCKLKFGKSKYFSIKKLKIKFKQNLNFYVGTFDIERNCIEVNPNKIKNHLDLITTIIHEYIHFKQDYTKYEEIELKLPRKRNYYDHPFELEAEEIAQLNKKQCYHDLKKILKWVKN